MSINLKMDADWVAVDWGSSYLRAWAMDKQGNIKAQRSSPQGIASLNSGEHEMVLLSLISEWLNIKNLPIIICGMAGSRQGWQEVPYQTVPLAFPQQIALTQVKTKYFDLKVYLLAGLAQSNPADVMRGEETQIAGFILDNPNYNGTLILPGTHSKWVTIQDRQVTAFSTCMTGELFNLLSTQSLLRHSVQTTLWSNEDFLQAFQETLDQPEQLMPRLFELRAKQLVLNTPSEQLKSQLSGLLIGAEFAAMRARGWLNQSTPMGIIGNTTLTALCSQALKTLNMETLALDSEAVMVKGLYSAYRELMQCNP